MSKQFYTPALAKIAERIRTQIESASTPDSRHNYSRQILSKADQLATCVKSLASQHKNPSPTVSVGYSDAQIGKNAKRLRVIATQIDTGTRAIATEGSAALTAAINKKARLVPDKFAPEIRQAFRGMKMQDKIAYMDEAIKRADGPGLSAVIDAPEVLTGLPGEMSGRFRLLCETTAAPQEVAERELLQTVWADCQAAIDAARQAAVAFHDPARLREIEQGEKAAELAAEEFRAAAVVG